jgi:hypothetical protein
VLPRVLSDSDRPAVPAAIWRAEAVPLTAARPARDAARLGDGRCSPSKGRADTGPGRGNGPEGCVERSADAGGCCRASERRRTDSTEQDAAADGFQIDL